MSAENINIWCWIIPALVGLIAGILGYLIGKGKDAGVVDSSAELATLESENARLNAELEACNKKLVDEAATGKTESISNSLASPSTR